MARFDKLTVFLIVAVMVTSAVLIIFTPAAAAPSVTVIGPVDVDEGVSNLFLGSISGYGTGTPEGYDIDNTLSEPYIDASGGTVLWDTYGYNKYTSLTLAFDFEYWGVQYNAGRTIYVSTTGLMDFGSPNTRHTYYYNRNIPETSSYRPNNAAYVYWDSLRVRGTSYNSYIYTDVGVATSGSMAGHTYQVIEWKNIFASSYTSDPGTFEIILWDNDVIDMRYQDVNFRYSSYDFGRSATVGLENQDGTEAAKHSYNTAGSISNGMNIRYTWQEAGGTGYQWKVDGSVVNSGFVSSDPFSTLLSHTFPDGPATGVMELVITYDGAPIDSTTHTVTVHNVAPLVYDDGTYADNYAGGSDKVYLGDWIYFHGHISDVPADTPADWAAQQWVEVTPGSPGVEYEITPYTGPYAQYWDYNWEIKFLRPGTYTAWIYAYDKDGGIGWGTDEDAPRTVVVMEHIRWQWDGAGHGLKVLDAGVIPSEVQAGGMTLAYLDVMHDHPDPDVQVPLVKEDFQTTLPSGWEMIKMYGPEWINGGATESLVAVFSIPPGEAVGEYKFILDALPYTEPNHWHEIAGGVWWCGDDATGGYGQYYHDPLKYENVYVDAQYLKLTHSMVADSASGGCVLIDDGTGWDLLTPLDGYVDTVFSLGRALDLPYTVDGPGFTGIYNGVDYFDLSAYYGQTVEIILMFASWYSSGYRGWDIYDLSLCDLAFTTAFFDDFESGPGNWDTHDRYGVADYTEDTSGDCSMYWIDIVDPANDLGIDEDYPDRFKTIPYDFTLYGNTYTELSVVAFGYIKMGTPLFGIVTNNNNAATYQFPASHPIVKDIIAPYWDDLSPGSGWGERGKVYAKQIGTKLVITYDDVQIGYSSRTHATFQVILDNSDNTIRFNYKEMIPYSSYYRTPTVGLNAEDGVRSELYYYRHTYPYWDIGTYPSDCTTILYTPGPIVKVGGWEITPDGLMTDSPGVDYASYFDTYLTLLNGVYLQVSNEDTAQVQFDHMYWVWGGDRLWVEVSTDDGATWDQVEMYGYYDVTQTPGYPTSTEHVFIDLRDYVGETILLRFRLSADTYGHHDGWYLDNIELSTAKEDITQTLEATDPRPNLVVRVVEKMKGTELAYYRHSQNALREIVVLYLNLEDGMPDDGSLKAALEAYISEDFGTAQDIAKAANENGNGYGYWVHEGGYDYFLNPGKNGNGMAGLTGKEARD
jgi:hypothetical protein